MTHDLTRRAVLTGIGATALAGPALAANPKAIGWDDLIPPDVNYPEIIAEGEMDEQADVWKPVFDENGTKMNEALNGKLVRMPGYIIPLDYSSDGVTSFLLVPYVGACIHVPPPPPNQLILVNTDTPWPDNELWAPIWITGILRTSLQSTDLAEIGYAMEAKKIEAYTW